MAEHPDLMRTIGESSADTTAADEILAVIAAEEPHGATADQVVRTISCGLDGTMVQGELEDLVMRGVLDRRGIGLGAVYTLRTTA